MVSPRDVQALLVANAGDLDAAARALVDAANAGGGEDNITVVLFQMVGREAAETVERPVVVPAATEPEADDEDTLSGLDPVPVVDTAVIAPAAVEEHVEQLEAEPTPPRKPRRRLGPLIALVLLVGAIAVLVAWGLTR